MGDERYLSAREAAGGLGVSLPTLYAYVSRGLVRSESGGEGNRRARRYRAEDVRRLRERAERRRNPDRAAEGVLNWGTPVMESAITLISDGRLYYRGRDVLGLARGGGVEEVAALIWTGDPTAAPGLFPEEPSVLPARVREARSGLDDLAPLETLSVLLPLAASGDPAAYDLRPAAVARTGARILRTLVAISAGEASGDVAGALARAWAPDEPGARALIGAALVLCADHELNVSAFTARCVASSGATPYAAVAAALAALGGTRHGGQTELAEALLREAGDGGDARSVLAGRLRRGESIPGFGHSLYPEGDPRGRELLRLVEEARPGSPGVVLSRAVCEAARDLIGEEPTVDLGLAVVARVLGLPPGTPLALFALGRTIGWIGHAIEQYEDGTMIRPRARYTGEGPPREPGA
ncbi:citrate synthase family protein [Rubrobacter marinus]|uniref:citrate synthase family protein n=1 Tax=Rubrobacter marinus TaxID=2653852 RepID=UPI00140CDEEB|nr:citrate synthase family protein [Rubrobacter marinus]